MGGLVYQTLRNSIFMLDYIFDPYHHNNILLHARNSYQSNVFKFNFSIINFTLYWNLQKFLLPLPRNSVAHFQFAIVREFVRYHRQSSLFARWICYVIR